MRTSLAARDSCTFASHRHAAYPSMDSSLFIPTYGQPAKGNTSKSRVLQPKSSSSSFRPAGVSKRSLMPSLVFNGKIEYVQSFEAAEKAALALEQARPEVLGFDIEWQVSFVTGEAPRPTATLQLCVPDHPATTATTATATSSATGDIRTSQTQPQTPNTPSRSASSGEWKAQHARPSSSSLSSSAVWGTAFIFHLSSMRGHPSAVRDLPRPKSNSTSPSLSPSPTSPTSPTSPRSPPSSPSPPLENTTPSSKDTGSGLTAGSSSSSSSSSSGSDSVETTRNPNPQHHRFPATAARLPDSLVRVLSDPGILLAGVGVGGDVSRLEREYDQVRTSGIRGIVDLSELAKRKVAPDRRRRGMWSLSDLCGEMLQLDLRKPSSLRTGSWEKRPLSVDQLFYAAADAYAGLRLWQVMQEMPDLVLQRSVATGSSGGNKTVAGVAARTEVEGKLEANVGGCATPALGGKVAPASDVENKAQESVEVPSKPRLPLSKLETHRLWHEDGLPVDAVAEVRCTKATTVRGYLADCIEAGLPYDWTRIGIDSAKEHAIVRALLAATGAAGGGGGARLAATGPNQAASTRASSNDNNDNSDNGKRVTPVVGTCEGESGGSKGGSDGESETGRWDSVVLKEVKELVAGAEYWEIRTVLARIKSGRCSFQQESR